MYTTPNTLPPTSRIWIYQSNRILTPDEELKILEAGKQFVDQWTAHNQSLMASVEIMHHAFLVIMVDQEHAGASGCSIDKSVHFVQQVEKQFGLTFLDRMNVAYRQENEIRFTNINKFNTLVSEGKINQNTIVFNNLVETKEDLGNNWEVPLSRSWHKQLL
jgi:hypothetical protein